MKQSKYNILRKIGDKFYIINILSSSFVEISKEEYIELNKAILPVNISEKSYNELCKNDMLIPKEIDELELLKERYIKAQRERDLLTITIAPTLRCNFECSYCYENRNGKIINNYEQVKIIDFISKQLKMGYKKLNLIWFGGEPLIVFDIIKNMSKTLIKLCEEKGVKYDAFLTTNGYLLTERIMAQLEELKIKQLFITLDGPKVIHDQRRHLLGGGETFERIVANLFKAKKYGVETIIRMNVDKTNSNYIEELRDYVTNKLNLGMYLGLVREYTASCNNKNNCFFNKKEYAFLLDEFEENQSRDKYVEFSFPRQKTIYCRATKVGTFVIDPDLNLFKCENDIGRPEKRISNVEDYPFNNEIKDVLNRNFYEWNPFKYKKCCECKLLPICIGGCPFISMKQNEPECETYKYNIDNHIKKHILQRSYKSINHDK